MYLLDTDHMSVLRRGGTSALSLELRLSKVPEEDVVTCIVVYEEQMRGWLAEIAHMRTGAEFVMPYNWLAVNLAIYCSMTLLPFDSSAAKQFDDLKRQKIRLGTQDLKIAAIALANDATLLTRNTTDFRKIPDLKFEDWSE